MENTVEEKILDYWYSLEFLSQDKYPNSWNIRHKVKEHKSKVTRGTAEKKTVEDFIILHSNDIEKDLYELIVNEACECGMKNWGNLTFYIGKVKREHCIEVYFKSSSV